MMTDHDIEADWTMYLTCNFACSYCFFTPEQLRSKLVVAATSEGWQQAFDATGLTWLIHMTGGEPTICPDFAGLCERLSRRHLISLNTNLSHKSIQAFAHSVDPARVRGINAAFHPRERANRNGDAAFIVHFNLLRAKGFAPIASVVATPDALRGFESSQARLAADGIVLVPKRMRGMYEGKCYPDAYSEDERQLFRSFLALARAHPEYRQLLSAVDTLPTVNPFQDDRHLAAEPVFIGRACGAGLHFVQISPNGSVTRCPGVAMGNLLDGSFVRAKHGVLCQSSYCHYWCVRHADMSEPEELVVQRRAILQDLHAVHVEMRALQTRLKSPKEQAEMHAFQTRLKFLKEQTDSGTRKLRQLM